MIRSLHHSSLFLLGTLAIGLLTGCSTAPKSSDREPFLAEARTTTKWFEQNRPGISTQIDNSGGFVVFSDIAQWGLLFSGGSFGRGAVCKSDGTLIGWAAVNKGSLGLQAGVQGFRMLLVLEDQKALEKLKLNQLSGSASATLVAADAGGQAATPFNEGVAAYVGANEGLMAGVSVGLNYIRYVPLDSTDPPADLR